MFSNKKYDELLKLCAEQNEIIKKQNAMIKQGREEVKQGREEVKQAMKLLDLYEACINKGVKIDFPNSTGGGGKEDNSSGVDTTFTF